MIQRKPPKKLTYEDALEKNKARQQRAKKRAEKAETIYKDVETPARPKVKAKKPLSVAKLKKKADAVFSKYIRLRDAHYRAGGWWCQCCTCGAWKPIKQIQNGHFQSRRFMNTRFHEQNCHAQCVKCNMFNQGEQYKYSLFVEKKYGPGTAEKLERLAQVEKRFKTWELEAMIDEWNEKIAEYERKQLNG